MVMWVKQAAHVGGGREEKEDNNVDHKETTLEVSAGEEANIPDALASGPLNRDLFTKETHCFLLSAPKRVIFMNHVD